jgi:hypothetical protein
MFETLKSLPQTIKDRALSLPALTVALLLTSGVERSSHLEAADNPIKIVTTKELQSYLGTILPNAPSKLTNQQREEFASKYCFLMRALTDVEGETHLSGETVPTYKSKLFKLEPDQSVLLRHLVQQLEEAKPESPRMINLLEQAAGVERTILKLAAQNALAEHMGVQPQDVSSDNHLFIVKMGEKEIVHIQLTDLYELKWIEKPGGIRVRFEAPDQRFAIAFLEENWLKNHVVLDLCSRKVGDEEKDLCVTWGAANLVQYVVAEKDISSQYWIAFGKHYTVFESDLSAAQKMTLERCDKVIIELARESYELRNKLLDINQPLFLRSNGRYEARVEVTPGEIIIPPSPIFNLPDDELLRSLPAEERNLLNDIYTNAQQRSRFERNLHEAGIDRSLHERVRLRDENGETWIGAYGNGITAIAKVGLTKEGASKSLSELRVTYDPAGEITFTSSAQLFDEPLGRGGCIMVQALGLQPQVIEAINNPKLSADSRVNALLLFGGQYHSHWHTATRGLITYSEGLAEAFKARLRKDQSDEMLMAIGVDRKVALEVCSAVANDSDPEVRRSAIQVIAALERGKRDEQRVTFLERFLKDKDSNVACEAALAIQWVGKPLPIEPLKRYLKTVSPKDGIPSERFDNILNAFTIEPSASVNYAMASLLSSCCRDQLFDAFWSMFHHSSPVVRGAAIDQLAIDTRLTDEERESLFRDSPLLLSEGGTENCTKILRAWGAFSFQKKVRLQQALEECINRVAACEPDIFKKAFADAVSPGGDKAVIDRLKSWKGYRERGITCLARFGDNDVLKKYLKQISKAPRQNQTVVRVFASKADHNGATVEINAVLLKLMDAGLYVEYIEIGGDRDFERATQKVTLNSEGKAVTPQSWIISGHGSADGIVFGFEGDASKQNPEVTSQFVTNLGRQERKMQLGRGGQALVFACATGEGGGKRNSQVFGDALRKLIPQAGKNEIITPEQDIWGSDIEIEKKDYLIPKYKGNGYEVDSHRASLPRSPKWGSWIEYV